MHNIRTCIKLFVLIKLGEIVRAFNKFQALFFISENHRDTLNLSILLNSSEFSPSISIRIGLSRYEFPAVDTLYETKPKFGHFLIFFN